MSLRVFLVQPSRTIVYSFRDGVVYNAGSLRRQPNLVVQDHKEISGLVTAEYGVLPVVIGRESGELGVVYAYDGKISDSTTDGTAVVTMSEILIPDMAASTVGNDTLTPVSLRAPDMQRLDEYIRRSSPAPTIRKTCSPTRELQDNVDRLSEQVEELRDQFDAFMRRMYRLYPVLMPERISDGLAGGEMIPVTQGQQMVKDQQVASLDLHPRLQAYAGSFRNNNRMLTLTAVDGRLYHVIAAYNSETGEFSDPNST